MQIALPLEKMTTQEKLCAMEEIWDNLAHKPGQVPSPAWHGEELKIREERLAKGLTRFSDWSDVKQELRARFADDQVDFAEGH